jgi:hypothetical protein
MDGPKARLRLVSGGQTGVDRAALDVAIQLGLPHGGWCPKGRRAEDGRIPDKYQLCELKSLRFADRTRRNVRDSDATLILAWGPLTRGTKLTLQHAEELGRPALVVQLAAGETSAKTIAWLDQVTPGTLNVAGPRGSAHPDLYRTACDFLEVVLRHWQENSERPS